MADFTIIGSGAGGSAAALELLKNKKSVEIFEEGIEYKNNRMTVLESLSKIWRNNGITLFHGKPILNFAEGKCIGGSTVINGGVIAHTNEEILSKWDDILGENFFLSEDFNKKANEVEESLTNENKIAHPEYVSNSSKLLIKAAKQKNYIVMPTKLAFKNIKTIHNHPFGCENSNKNSLDKNYHIKIKKLGGKIKGKSKLLKIYKNKEFINEILIENTEDKSLKKIKVNNLVLSAGCTQTPKLLLQNELVKKVNPLNFHFNLKILCNYNDKVNCQISSLLSHHIREFEKDGVLFMASNYIKPLIASYLSFESSTKIKEFMSKFEFGSVFNCQIRPDFSQAKINKSIFFNDTVINWNLHDKDFEKIKKYLKILSELVFLSGAKEIILPIEKNNQIFNDLQDAIKRIDNLNKKDLEITSVHAMSSCSMSKNDKNITNTRGLVNGFKNLYIMDSSILPSNTGQHPQLTIMTTVKKLIEKNLESNKF